MSVGTLPILKKGRCLVEANWGEILSQFALAKGIRTEFEKRMTKR